MNDKASKWGLATHLQRAVLRFEVLRDTTDQTGELKALGATLGAAAKILREKLPASPEMPLYPAFSD